MKKCSKCKITKPDKSFSPSNQNKDGLSGHCKKCKRNWQKERRRSKEGLKRYMYTCQKMYSKKRGHNLPSYSLEEFIFWIDSQDNFDSLYYDWVKNKFNRWYKPSVDRLTDKEGYSLSNIRLVSWKENSEKNNINRKLGIDDSSGVPVIRIDEDGNTTEYPSIRQARQSNKMTNGVFLGIMKRKEKKNGYLFIRKQDYELL